MENEALTTAFETIADKLGIAATEIFRIFTEVQMLKGVLNILSVIILLVLVYFTFRTAFRFISGCSSYSEAREDCEFEVLILASIVITGVITFLYIIILDVIEDSILRIFYPEYTAIWEIIHALT